MCTGNNSTFTYGQWSVNCLVSLQNMKMKLHWSQHLFFPFGLQALCIIDWHELYHCKYTMTNGNDAATPDVGHFFLQSERVSTDRLLTMCERPWCHVLFFCECLRHCGMNLVDLKVFKILLITLCIKWSNSAQQRYFICIYFIFF